MISLNREKFLEQINAKWKTKVCPMCQKNNWSIGQELVSPMTLSTEGAIQIGGSVMPLVAMTCMNCGNVLFVNPLVIDAVNKTDEQK